LNRALALLTINTYLTQVRLAVSDEREARVSGECWYHRRRQKPVAAVRSEQVQGRLIDELTRLTGLSLP
jgi:hypothetical protein